MKNTKNNLSAIAAAVLIVLLGSTAAHAAATGMDATAVPSGAAATGDFSVAVGDGATAGTTYSDGTPDLLFAPTYGYGNQVAIGTQSTAWGTGDLAVGNWASAVSQPLIGTYSSATAVGYRAGAWGNYSSAFGQGASAGGAVSGSVPTTTPTISGATAIGALSNAAATNSTAIGTGATAIGQNSVALGAGTVATQDNSVDVGGRQVTDVAAGTQATDAVNVAQLQAAIAGVGGVDSSAILSQANAYTDAAINSLRHELSQGIAAVAAAPALPALAPGQRAFAIGTGYYGGATAIGVTFAQATRSAVVNAGISTAGGRPVMRVGAAWVF